MAVPGLTVSAILACALGLGLAVGWTAALARVGPRGEALLSAGLLAGPIALAAAAPWLVPPLIAGLTAFNAVLALFLVWGLAAEETTVGGVGALAGLAGWVVAAVASRRVAEAGSATDGDAVLLAALPAVAAVALAREVAGRRARSGLLSHGLWSLAMFGLPAALAAWRQPA